MTIKVKNRQEFDKRAASAISSYEGSPEHAMHEMLWLLLDMMRDKLPAGDHWCSGCLGEKDYGHK